MNEHILNGCLEKQLLAMDLDKATHLHWTYSEPNSYILDGTTPIDGVYHSKELADIVEILWISKGTSILWPTFHQEVKTV
jgi:hypothetical protein